MTKRLRRSQMGFIGDAGGGWRQVPQPPRWFATSVQVCGIYPFGVGTGRPVDGSPLGRDMLTGAAVCTDHDALYRADVISSPSAFLFGLNGNGKSTTAQTLLNGQIGRGLTPAVFDPIKGEHVPWIQALGGTVYSIGPNARHRLNLLAPGPLGAAAKRIGGTVGAELQELARAKAVDLVKLCVKISRGSQEDVADIEETAIEAIVDVILDRDDSPVTADLLRVFDEAPLPVLQTTRQRDADAFHKRFRRLGETLAAMMTGQMGQMLGGSNSVQIVPGNPGGFCFDTSSIGQKNTKLLSAAMLSTWSLGMDAIDAHWELAQHEQRLAAEAADAGDRYEPQVRWGGYTTMFDEFWYPLRACDGMVDLVDGLSRTNRSVGTADLKISHSPKDLLSLRNPEDREKAHGFIERSGLLMLMALSREDLRALSEVRHLTPAEIRLVARFNKSKSWKGSRRVAAGGTKKAPPGAGKVLLKVSERVGIPVQMLRTATQQSLHETDNRYQ